MRVKFQGFLFGKNHSWSLVQQNLGREFLKMGYEVDFVSTDGFEEKFCPDDLRPYVKLEASGKYDVQISYTAPHNWPIYLNPAFGGKRFAIWNYEFNGKGILKHFAKYHKATDLVLPSSNFTKDVFLNMGIPEEKMVVVPHGVCAEDFQTDKKMELKTKASKKILLNIAQPHIRKNIPAALSVYGKAFNKNDDVCLVAKVMLANKNGHVFDVDFIEQLKTFEKNFPNHAGVEVKTDFVENVAEIYNACEINFSTTAAECWHLPSTEAMAAKLVNVVPRYGGILDFCTNQNSLLIDGQTIRANRKMQYWNFNSKAVCFKIDENDAVFKLQKAVSEYDLLRDMFLSEMKKTVEKFSWKNAAQQILDLAKTINQTRENA